MMRLGLVMAIATGGLVAMGCDGGGAADAGVDAGGSADAGCPEVPELCTEGEDGCTRPAAAEVECPDTMTPAPEEQMGTCCWRSSNSTRLDAPEMRLNYIDIVAPVGSALSSTTLRRVLNEAMQQETFNWLFRVNDAGADGDVTILTGFGRRQTDGTYAFSNGMDPDPATWCPVTIDATLTGETVASQAIAGSIVVPVFDDVTGELQVELTLRQLAIEQATWAEDRSCIGWYINRPFTYVPQGVLTAFIEVEPSRTGQIMVGSVNTTVCAAVAGSLSDPAYCDQPQSAWATPPDSLCDASGCQQNAPCQSDVCDPASTCNAWRLVGHFAAAGVDISNDACATP